ncbi:MAG: lactate racemase domain-containing protein [bacterium]
MERTVFCGNDRVRISLPDHTRLVFPPDPITGIGCYGSVVRQAIRNPLGCPALSDLVKPGSRVTIAFDDPCLPLPPMRRDVRGKVIGVVLEELFRAGVHKDRIRLVCANGLHRKWTRQELRRILGRRIWQEMGPQRILNHDAEDPAGVVELGKSASGHVVEVNRLVKESDLVIYVNVNWTSMNGGFKSILVGLGTFRSIRCHHNSAVLEQGTLMDPERSRYHRIMEEMGAVLSAGANVFTVETVLNNRIWGPLAARFLSLDGAQKKLQGGGAPSPEALPLERWFRRLPARWKASLASCLRSAYQPIGVHAGRIEEVHPMTLQILDLQQNTAVQGQTDALLLAMPNLSPYAAFSQMNPLLAFNMALGYSFNLHRRRPLVRDGGILIVMNPFSPGFHARHHPSYVEFYERVLPETREPREIEERFEMDFARRREYVHGYRFQYAYHGVHPLYVWMWGILAMKRLSRIIVVGAEDPKVVGRLGLAPAASLEQAFSMAEEILGKGFSLTHPVMPPIFCADVQV